MKNLILPIFFILFTKSILAQVELKTNIATLVAGIPNVGLEFQVGKNASIQLDVLGSFWDSVDGAPFQINQTFLEYRLYSNSNISEWFIGAHLGYGMFTIQKPYDLIISPRYSTTEDPDGAFRSGRSVFHGLTVGYKKLLNKRFSLELFIGGGYAMSHYKGYNGLNRTDIGSENYRPFNGSGEVLIYRGGLMIIYKIGPYKKKD
ncbi:hypothetical protein PI23P_10997 [Polaribacter irgensii 23-P]|uniref:DUF3575 domain-containing protein n=1 Tax=Polaribacter irgensii 23-P TaxID=313594 RepID=A4C152_9FLAO|nr:DUF3575 domain-containing protein [Polaribacter irgensii]EAR11855.1 hypothetical protein PI23P_10997 [Polaribacter irgensii 23-P]